MDVRHQEEEGEGKEEKGEGEIWEEDWSSRGGESTAVPCGGPSWSSPAPLLDRTGLPDMESKL